MRWQSLGRMLHHDPLCDLIFNPEYAGLLNDRTLCRLGDVAKLPILDHMKFPHSPPIAQLTSRHFTMYI